MHPYPGRAEHHPPHAVPAFLAAFKGNLAVHPFGTRQAEREDWCVITLHHLVRARQIVPSQFDMCVGNRERGHHNPRALRIEAFGIGAPGEIDH